MFFRRALSLSIAAIVLLISSGAGLAADPPTGREGTLAIQAPSNLINPIGTAFLICNIGQVAEVNPAVAYGSAHAEYLAVWYNDRTSNDDIMAQRFSKNGSLIGAPFYIATGGATIDRRYPRVAYDAKADQFLVVWEQSDSSNGSSIHGRLVSWDGALLYSDIAIESDGSSTYYPARPAVAYAYTSDKYLVVWQEFWQPTPSYNNIYGRVVYSSGSIGTGPINIAQVDGAHTQAVPDLAYNSLRDEYLVVWQQLDPNASLTDVWARRVSGAGTPQATPFVVAGYTKSTTSPAVAFLPVQPDGQYLVVWEQNYNPNDRDIVGRLVAWDGTYDPLVDISISVTNIVDELQPDVVANPARGAYLVSWKQVNIFPFSSIYARLVTPSGSLAGDSFNLGGIGAEHPRLAAGWNGDFAMVYDDVNWDLDWGTYGFLIGNRLYLPQVNK